MNGYRKRQQKTYDHRLRNLVRATGDPGVVTEFGVPRSTARGWLRGDCQPVVTADLADSDHIELQAEVVKLRRRNQKLVAIVRLLFALLRALDVRLDQRRLPDGDAKTELLRAIDRARVALSVQGALRVLRLSPARYHRWKRVSQGCGLEDRTDCPRTTPTRLSADEIRFLSWIGAA